MLGDNQSKIKPWLHRKHHMTWDISLWTTKFHLPVAQEAMSEDLQGHKDTSSEDQECPYKIPWQTIQ